MTANQLPENELDHVPASSGAELAAVSSDQSFASEAEIEKAIADLPPPPKKATVGPSRVGPIDEVVRYPRWVGALRKSALAAQIVGGFLTGYVGTRRFFESMGGRSLWDIADIVWIWLKRLVGYAT
jgi:hypothetical protein